MSRRAMLAALADTVPLRSLLRRMGRWRGAMVLSYHRIGDGSDEPFDHALWNATAEALDAQLAALAREAEVIDPAELAQRANGARKDRCVLITFDDGYRDNYDLAYPLLRARGLPATFFIATGFIDDRPLAWWDDIAWMVRNSTVETLQLNVPQGTALHIDRAQPQDAIARLCTLFKQMPSEDAELLLDQIADRSGAGRAPKALADRQWMTWQMISEMHAHGMSVGAHTVTHPLLARCPAERKRSEIETSCGRVREVLGEPTRWFAYPVGSSDAYDQQSQEILAGAGVELAFNLSGRPVSFADWRSLDVDRVAVVSHYTAPMLKVALWLPSFLPRS
ncbi:MAG: polysaccharide deacetylase family protein [Solirubrobacteraceae bacterium]